MSSIDNLALDIKDVRSIMVIPVFGHHLSGDDLKPIAVVQLINKIDHKLISEHDIVSYPGINDFSENSRRLLIWLEGA